ncbi:MAG: CerR family C-terminal domain-containing protein [Francisellaceae bacterium]
MDKKETTRDSLLQAGLDIFARYGYAGATTRLIAGQAHANISAIAYYFDGKEGLYHAVISHMIEKVKKLALPLKERLLSQLDKASDDELKTELEDFLMALTMITLRPEMKKISRIMLQEQLNPSSAFKIIYDVFTSNMLALLINILKKLSPHQSQDYYVLAAQTLVGQAMVFLIYRGNLTHAFGVDRFDKPHFEMHRHLIRKTIERFSL